MTVVVAVVGTLSAAVATDSLLVTDGWHPIDVKKVFLGPAGVMGTMAGCAFTTHGSLLNAIQGAVDNSTTPLSAAEHFASSTREWITDAYREWAQSEFGRADIDAFAQIVFVGPEDGLMQEIVVWAEQDAKEAVVWKIDAQQQGPIRLGRAVTGATWVSAWGQVDAQLLANTTMSATKEAGIPKLLPADASVDQVVNLARSLVQGAIDREDQLPRPSSADYPVGLPLLRGDVQSVTSTVSGH